MLPLRSRTSWRLRALTVTCLPRDWTWAGLYHFANNGAVGVRIDHSGAFLGMDGQVASRRLAGERKLVA
jgi:hypothetical protein